MNKSAFYFIVLTTALYFIFWIVVLSIFTLSLSPLYLSLLSLSKRRGISYQRDSDAGGEGSPVSGLALHWGVSKVSIIVIIIIINYMQLNVGLHWSFLLASCMHTFTL